MVTANVLLALGLIPLFAVTDASRCRFRRG